MTIVFVKLNVLKEQTLGFRVNPNLLNGVHSFKELSMNDLGMEINFAITCTFYVDIVLASLVHMLTL